MIPFDSKAVLNLLFESDERLTAAQYIRQIADHLDLPLREAKKIVKCLVRDQELTYIDLYGSTCVEKNFSRPVQLSPHFLVKPPQVSCEHNLFQITVSAGISFGSGQHPTTRLCIEALDACVLTDQQLVLHGTEQCADIGTGSGILAMAMILAGFHKCRAFEIDAVSVNEARKNVRENGLCHHIEIIDGYFVKYPEKYAMICANLRYPTLADLVDVIHASLKPEAIAVVSGFREWEKQDLVDIYTASTGMTCIWEKTWKKWSAAAFLKS